MDLLAWEWREPSPDLRLATPAMCAHPLVSRLFASNPREFCRITASDAAVGGEFRILVCVYTRHFAFPREDRSASSPNYP
jgi:hypothetical protein